MTPSIILRELPGIAEIERLECGQGAWLTEAELRERADAVSVALFGITEDDTYRQDLPIEQADAWEQQFDCLDDTIVEIDGVDVTDGEGDDLACLYLFGRQLIALTQGMIERAKLYPDGSGKGTSVDAEAWGAALERDARTFKPGR